ncbi:MAG: hypothetical protein RIR00_446 [Pseudomonadota bacterium]|jgi:hypothetical protein
MKQLLSLLALCLATTFAAGVHAEDKKLSPQQEKMKQCSAQAKGLKGQEYKDKRDACLRGEAAAAAPAPANDCAAKAAEKKLAGAAKASFMKKCTADAK